MERLLWFIAGSITCHLVSGYVEGFLEAVEEPNNTRRAKAEEV